MISGRCENVNRVANDTAFKLAEIREGSAFFFNMSTRNQLVAAHRLELEIGYSIATDNAALAFSAVRLSDVCVDTTHVPVPVCVPVPD